jgi:hypothetical protein
MHARENTETKIFMAINKFQKYTFFTGKGSEFYQWLGNAPNGAIVSNLKLKDRLRSNFLVPIVKLGGLTNPFFCFFKLEYKDY